MLYCAVQFVTAVKDSRPSLRSECVQALTSVTVPSPTQTRTSGAVSRAGKLILDVLQVYSPYEDYAGNYATFTFRIKDRKITRMIYEDKKN
ncbi:MAG: hypothetical protein IJG36_11160 [Synergistaceae bacterium]|nr:hypothetical protein [Synergistaceae bacterium]